MPTSPPLTRITVGTTVTPTASSHPHATIPGTVTEIHGAWARVRWDGPEQRESLEWLGSLLPMAASQAPPFTELIKATEDASPKRTGN